MVVTVQRNQVNRLVDLIRKFNVATESKKQDGRDIKYDDRLEIISFYFSRSLGRRTFYCRMVETPMLRLNKLSFTCDKSD